MVLIAKLYEQVTKLDKSLRVLGYMPLYYVICPDLEINKLKQINKYKRKSGKKKLRQNSMYQ